MSSEPGTETCWYLPALCFQQHPSIASIILRHQFLDAGLVLS